MAPGRKKGVKRGGDKREFRAGDLVLAKLKGHPPWPAMVDEPLRWGIDTEWKKVFVSFYGTRQIAFCNQADVEAFTEEKMELFKVKHESRDAFFVCAVEEILEKFETLKNEDKLQDSILPSSKIIEGAGIVDRYGMRDPSGRSKRIKKSPDVSKFKDVDSPAAVSSGSYKKKDTETGTVDSNSLSFNEGSTVQSGYGLPQTESVVERSEGDTELIQRLDLQSSAVIKNKRKPIRKRANSGTNELIDRLEKEPGLKIEGDKAGQILPSNNKDHIDEDGDEHLPLLKRARVRMGRLSSEVEEPDSSVQPILGRTVEDEASLPPSKRIQRALEAMSANVAEAFQEASKGPSSMRAFVNASTNDNTDPLPCNLRNNCATTNMSKFDTDKDKDIRSSPSTNGGSDSALVPLDNTSGCNVSASENIVFYSRHAKKENSKAQDTLQSFKAYLRYLTRTKDRIGCATRIAIDCGKRGIASEVVEVLASNLEREPSLPKRVDMFFLVDSILRRSQGSKGGIGDLFTSAIQAQLPRFLLAAAPPGSNGQENRRECLKVLRLWQERRVLSESVIQCHIQDLNSASYPASGEPNCPRLERNERALDDVGMVDEFGRPKDEGFDDMGNFEAVTPEHNSEKPEEQIPRALNGKRTCILDAVDCEVEMEIVEPELCSTGNVQDHTSEHRFEQKSPVNLPPPLPKNVAPSSPWVASPPPPLLPLPPFSAFTPLTNSNLYTNDGKQQTTALCSAAPRVDPISVDGRSYNGPDNGDLRMSMQLPESAKNGSFGSVPVRHSPIRPLDSFPQVGGAISHNRISDLRPRISESVNSRTSGGVAVSRPAIQPGNSVSQVNEALSQKKAFNSRPPRPAPSNQFSYGKADHRKVDYRTQTRDIPTQSYSSRFHPLRNRDRGNFYGVHDRFQAGRHDVGNNWSHTEPYIAGPSYHNRRRLPYAHDPYGSPLRELPLGGQPLGSPMRGQPLGSPMRELPLASPMRELPLGSPMRELPIASPMRELPLQNRGWAFPPRAMNHREGILRRPPLGSPLSGPSRGPNHWQPSPSRRR